MKCNTKHLYLEASREEEKPKSLPQPKYKKKMNQQIHRQKITPQLGHLIFNFEPNPSSNEIKKENEKKN